MKPLHHRGLPNVFECKGQNQAENGEDSDTEDLRLWQSGVEAVM